MYGPIGCDWMFQILGVGYREPEGEPIVRIMKQLREMARVIARESELGVRNPEAAWDWLCKKRRGLKSTGSFLTSREMYIYFKDRIVVKSQKLSAVIGRHCLSVDFAGDLGESDGVEFQAKFPSYIRTIDGNSDSESIRNNLGKRVFTNVQK